MDSEVKTAEQRVKSFTGQLQTECGILERLVYKHKNQMRRCSFFQYILKVRRDLQLLKLANVEEVLESASLVINGDRPKQKVQLLESLKRRKTNGGKYNFLERLLGVARLLSQIVEPLLKAAIEISMLLASSFFGKFSLAILAVLARTRVLVQQMLLDVVVLYNTVSSLSQREQSIKLKQEGFEVFREYFPRKEEARILLECMWQKDKFVLVERTHKSEITSQEKDDLSDISLSTPQILYENIEVILGVDESGATTSLQPAIETFNVEENCSYAGSKNDEKNVPEATDTTQSSPADIDSSNRNKWAGDESCCMSTSEAGGARVEAGPPASSSASTLLYPVRKDASKKVAFVAVKPPAPAPSTTDQSRFQLKGTESNDKDSFFNLLSGVDKSSLL